MEGMSMTKQTTNVSAMSLLNYGREYHEAAEALFDSKPSLTRVLNFLYFHTVELLLKSYLRAHGRTPWGHEISELYAEAEQLGLKIPHDPLGLHNVVTLLETGNEDMAFRYFTLKSGSEPDLTWTRRVVAELLQAVTPFVESTWDKSASGKPVKMTMTWSIPAPTKA
jgi:HEPN domain-containing protein